MKNYKKRELTKLLEVAKLCFELGLSLPDTIDGDGRPCDWDRVRRQYGKDYEFLRQPNMSSWHVFLSRVTLKTTPTDYKIEHSLRVLKGYWCSIIARNDTRGSIRQKRNVARISHDPINVEVGFFGGLTLLAQGQTQQGWLEIQEMRDAVIPIIRSQEPTLLLSLISLISAKSWIKYPDLFRTVAKDIIDACDKFLETSHPLTMILKTFVSIPVTAAVIDEYAELCYQVMVETVNEHPKDVKCDPYYIHCAEDYLIKKIKSRLERWEAYEFLQLKIAHYKRTVGPRSRHTISMQSQLAEMYLDEAREQMLEARPPEESEVRAAAWEREALKQPPEPTDWKDLEDKGKVLLKEIIEQAEENPKDRKRIGTYSLAARDLARLSFANGECKEAHKYYCNALHWGAEKFGSSHPHVSALLHEFKHLQRLTAPAVDIEQEEDVGLICQGKRGRPQERSDERGENVSPAVDSCEVEMPEANSIAEEVHPVLNFDALDDRGEDEAQYMIDSGIEPEPVDVDAFDQVMQSPLADQALDGCPTTLDDIPPAKETLSQDLQNEMLLDESPENPMESLGEIIYETLFEQYIQTDDI
jgi:hypothetical protein